MPYELAARDLTAFVFNASSLSSVAAQWMKNRAPLLLLDNTVVIGLIGTCFGKELLDLRLCP